jgi:predicted dehydrogenase
MKIACIGAGGIMRNAHLPAYQDCGFEVAAICDPNREASEELAVLFDIPLVANSIANLPQKGVIYDLATPASAIPQVLSELPDNCFALLQKPMGETLKQAKEIVRICDDKGIRAAVNFQLRWAPYVLALKELIASTRLGEIHDLEFKVNVHTPWALWDFLEIHYIDLVRDLFGEPDSVWARSIRHPDAPKLESSRSLIYFEYGDLKRAIISTYHGHKAGPKHQESYIKLEGTKGVAKLQMGLNLDYPHGGEDYLEVWTEGEPSWKPVEFEGSWFPDAYKGPMTAMMAWASGGLPPSTEIHSALKTMEWVEQAYAKSDAMQI